LPLAISIILSVFYFRANQRIKNNEADKGEIENLRSIIDSLRDESERQGARIAVLEENELVHRKQMLDKDMELIDYENILIQYKRIMNFGCEKFETTCEIGKKYRELIAKNK
jgi:hypothetical protein